MMRWLVFVGLLFVASNAQNTDIEREQRLTQLFGNSSNFIPPGYEEVTRRPPEAYEALPRCGEGPDAGKKVCIVYHRCDPTTNTVTPEEINTTGEGLIDIRGQGDCEHYMDVCCNLPGNDQLTTTTTTTTLKPIETGPPPPPPGPSFCGVRNKNGLDFKLKGNTNEAEYGEFPWTVAILSTSDNPPADKTPFLCGGSLIAPGVVLTGAHCVHKYQSQFNQIKVRAGEWDALSNSERLPFQERTVKRIIIHKEFNPKTVVNDVALLILERPYSKADNIATICLPIKDQVFTSRECFASGWGKKEFGNKAQYSAILKKLQLPMVQHDQCEASLKQTRLGSHFVLDRSFVCAGGEGLDTCTGDGGSPLICPDPTRPDRYYQVGIVAWGIGCAQKGVPGVYANVPRYRDWIDEQMAGLGLSTKPYNI